MNEIHGTTKLVGIIGWPVEHSLSPRMQNAAFAALGLDWDYVPLPTRPERLADAVKGSPRSASPVPTSRRHTSSRSPALRDRCASVNTLVVREGGSKGGRRTRRFSTGSTTESRWSSATAARPRRSRTRCRRRAPVLAADRLAAGRRTGADLVVNATSARDEVLVELGPGQTLVDLPYPETATGAAARRAGATVIGGLEVLVAQGAASFELWTGVPAPIDAMRAAVGLPV